MELLKKLFVLLSNRTIMEKRWPAPQTSRPTLVWFQPNASLPTSPRCWRRCTQMSSTGRPWNLLTLICGLRCNSNTSGCLDSPQVLWLWSGGTRELGGLPDSGPGLWNRAGLLYAESAGGGEGSRYWDWYDWGAGNSASHAACLSPRCVRRVIRFVLSFSWKWPRHTWTITWRSLVTGILMWSLSEASLKPWQKPA